MAFFGVCECGVEEQTVDHVVFQCLIHQPSHGLYSLTDVDEMRQSTDCSTPAPRSSMAKQWIVTTHSNDEKVSLEYVSYIMH